MRLGPFIKKETLHILRDRRMLIVVLMIPVVQMVLFGFAISMEINNINVGVNFKEYSEDIRQKIESLQANPYITLMGTLEQSEIYPQMQSGKVDAVVVFRDADDVQIISDASNPNIAQSSAAYITAILSGNSGNPSNLGNSSNNDKSSLIDTHFLYNPQLRSGYNFVPGVMGMLFLLVCALMTAVSIVREKETGTMELLLVSPVRPGQIIICKMVPFFVLSCLDLWLVLVIAKYLLDVPFIGGILPIIIVSLLYIVLSLGFGLLVSTIAKSQVIAMLISGMVMIMPVIMLSGMIFPVDNLPVVLRQISYIVPAQWYIDSMRRLMIEGAAITVVWFDVAILCLMTIVIYVVAIKKFKDRLS